MGRREQRERERKRAATSCKSIEHFFACSEAELQRSRSAQSHTSTTTSVHDSVQSSLAQNSTACCTTSDTPASPTPSPVSSVSLTKCFISTGSQIHSSTEPCLSSSVHSTTFEPQVHQPPIFSQSGDSVHPDIGIIYVDCKQNSRNFCTSIQCLSAAEKYALFKKHNKPSEDHAFPYTLFGKYNRRF